ncbi:hypothetical protein ACFQ48_08905 [Hymenobacter caeli]|uniref:STAS/SEC14 domain-containing protein n=1 Tax=Hymenobacter caeli TaxID=2735894 RepID=A0ABX2FRF5_9BACT|nr:hypothetical protein [Hymenobacter caeli]NRT19022.1 hypothetical protein [Hymenobacter caeli]
MLIRHLPDFYLQHAEALGLLRVEWVSGPNTQRLRASAGQLLDLAHRLGLRRLLIDMNTVPDLPVADQLWLGAHWMPGLVQLPLQHLVLVIDQSRVHNQLAIDALHDLVQPAIRFDAHYFSDPESAMRWLTDGTDDFPALMAEWRARHPPGSA